ncbi:MAG: Ankyrin [Blastococcus sp.]|nr:Ankyrin [Blastococcus sp.]
MTTPMTAQRRARLIAAGDLDGVRAEVEDAPRLGSAIDAASAAYLRDVDRLAGALDDGVAPTGAAGRALNAATGAGRGELVQLMLGAGAEVDRRDPDTGPAPVHAAVAAGTGGDSPDVVRALPGTGADVDATTSDRASALGATD